MFVLLGGLFWCRIIICCWFVWLSVRFCWWLSVMILVFFFIFFCIMDF